MGGFSSPSSTLWALGLPVLRVPSPPSSSEEEEEEDSSSPPTISGLGHTPLASGLAPPAHSGAAVANKALLLQSGRIALGTDFPVEEVSPIKTFYAAVARKDSEQFPEDGYLSENKLSRIEAMQGMTIWGAYANFEEDEKGSIEVGKNADFIMLDRDIIKVSERRILKARIVATILNGNVVYSNRFR